MEARVTGQAGEGVEEIADEKGIPPTKAVVATHATRGVRGNSGGSVIGRPSRSRRGGDGGGEGDESRPGRGRVRAPA